MPVYDYECDKCGVFTALRPMSKSAEACQCPDCGSMSERVFLTVPNFACMDASIRIAHATNEKAADQPKTSKAGHGPGCGCCGSSPKPSRTVHRPDGSKAFPSARPWMISH